MAKALFDCLLHCQPSIKIRAASQLTACYFYFEGITCSSSNKQHWIEFMSSLINSYVLFIFFKLEIIQVIDNPTLKGTSSIN